MFHYSCLGSDASCLCKNLEAKDLCLMYVPCECMAGKFQMQENTDQKNSKYGLFSRSPFVESPKVNFQDGAT